MKDAMDALGRYYADLGRVPVPETPGRKNRSAWLLAPVGAGLGYAATYLLMAIATAPVNPAAPEYQARWQALRAQVAERHGLEPPLVERAEPHGRRLQTREEKA
jgi:hypothetical protein